MEYRILGRTGLRVSAVALGCEGFIHKTPEEVCADFDFAIGHGVNFIDIYSPNPELRTNIGAALEGRRGDFVIQGHLCTTWENGQYLRTRDCYDDTHYTSGTYQKAKERLLKAKELYRILQGFQCSEEASPLVRVKNRDYSMPGNIKVYETVYSFTLHDESAMQEGAARFILP